MSNSGIDEVVMHREGNIKWEEISKVMRDGKNPSGTQEAIEAHKISHSETYESLYMELLDKCNPRNFMEPYDKKKVDAAILIYNDLSRIDKTNEKHIRVIRDRATLELGINVSTDRLYKELIDYCNPQNFLTTVTFFLGAAVWAKAGAAIEPAKRNVSDKSAVLIVYYVNCYFYVYLLQR